MSVTIRDVAKEAGVSISTVSKVLNNWTTISSTTVSKVNAAIEKLHYTPNARAVNFAKGSTNNIVFLAALNKDAAYLNPHMFAIMCGANQRLTEAGYTMTLIDSSNESNPGERIHTIISKQLADGIIIHGSSFTKECTELIIEKQYPHIIIGRPDNNSQLCWVDTNHALAGQYAAKHMLACGYTNVAFIGGKTTDYISIQRQKGFLSSMYDYGYSVPDSLIGYTDSSVKDSYDCALDILKSKKPPRAIVCENNTITVGVMKAIEFCNLKIPSEIALLTFDSYPYSTIITPQPTVIDINVYDMGREAGNIILQKVHNPALQVQSFITLPYLNLGQTTMLKNNPL
ncbi:periplasmic binding protein/LacI transcriptional regulator [Lachnospiraceae bacterium KM106-2]|nr:periplasmic binding protein/LacI transcriptional regulator [Lachnospiraceae bacterium KM106-2]